MRLLLAAAVLAMMLLPTLAFADAIGPPPEKCPPGSVGTSSHEGDWCQPGTCSTDGHCPDNASCKPDVGLCVTHDEVPCGGLYPRDMEPCTTTLDVAHDACATNADCSEGTCEIAHRCVPSWNPLRGITKKAPTSGSKQGCGCGRDAAPGGAGAALLLGLLLLRLRRVRRS